MPTAIDPIDPGLVLGQLETLRKGIHEAVTREDELTRTREERRVTVLRQITAREQHDAQELKARINEVDEAHREAIEHSKIGLEARRARIHNAYHSSRTALTDRFQGLKNQRIGAAHGELMTQRQRRKQELAEAANAHQAFKGLLGEDLEIRQQLRHSLRSALRSYQLYLLRDLDRAAELSADEVSHPPEDLRAAGLADLEAAREAIAAAHRSPLAKVFRFLPFLVLAAIAAGVIIGLRDSTKPIPWPAIGLAEGALVLVWLVGLALAWSPGLAGTRHLRLALAHAQMARRASSARGAAIKARLEQQEQEESAAIGSVFNEAGSDLQATLSDSLRKLEHRHTALPAKLDKLQQRKLVLLARRHEQALALVHSDAAEIALERAHDRTEAMCAADRVANTAIQAFATPWKTAMTPVAEILVALDPLATSRFPAWTPEGCTTWTPPETAPQAIAIGHIAVDLTKLDNGIPKSPQLVLPGPTGFAVPFALGFPEHGSLLIETTGDPTPAIEALNGIAIRLLASLPPGRASFVFIDPVGLGQNFAGLMHLADYEESLINRRIWTQRDQIEERLAELSEHIEKVIQMYLRNEYATITEYNEQAGSVAEKYHFLVVADFPAGFSETAAKRLQSIAASGARCGVFTLIHWDRAPAAAGRLRARRTAQEQRLPQAPRKESCHRADPRRRTPRRGSRFDPPPDAETRRRSLVHKIGKAASTPTASKCPSRRSLPPAGEMWTSDTTSELRVAIGRTGATKLQYLAIGKGTRQHALFAGKTGSGKSTLFHVIITNLALCVQPGAGRVLPHRFQEGRRVQVLRRPSACRTPASSPSRATANSASACCSAWMRN